MDKIKIGSKVKIITSQETWSRGDKLVVHNFKKGAIVKVIAVNHKSQIKSSYVGTDGEQDQIFYSRDCQFPYYKETCRKPRTLAMVIAQEVERIKNE